MARNRPAGGATQNTLQSFTTRVRSRNVIMSKSDHHDHKVWQRQEPHWQKKYSTDEMAYRHFQQTHSYMNMFTLKIGLRLCG